MNKNILFPIVLGVVLVGCFYAVNVNHNAIKENLKLERYTRLDTERKLDAALKNSRQLEQQLSDARRRLEGIQNIVNEGQSAASELKATVANAEKENSDLKISVKKLQDELQKVTAQRDQAVAEVAAGAAAKAAAQAQTVN